jgi:hypothetical protein
VDVNITPLINSYEQEIFYQVYLLFNDSCSFYTILYLTTVPVTKGTAESTGNSQNSHHQPLSGADTTKETGSPPFDSCTNDLMNQDGVSINSLPSVDFVRPNLRKDILAGKDICLASLLIPDNKQTTPKEIIIGDEAFTVKAQSDMRLTHPLSIENFTLAFNKYKNIICEAFPNRRKELDAYHSSILNMSRQYGGTHFYEYHKQFSFKAAQFLHQRGIKIDWSVRDSELYMSTFTGIKVNTCDICSSSQHTSTFCDRNVPSSNQQRSWAGGLTGKATSKSPYDRNTDSDIRGRHIATAGDGRQICNNYNGGRGCVFGQRCYHAHVCLGCQKAHPQHKCPESKNLKSTYNGLDSMGGKPINTIPGRSRP